MWGLWFLVTLEMALRVDVVSFLVLLWLVVLMFWQKSWYFTLLGCCGPGMRATIMVILFRKYFTLRGCVTVARLYGLTTLHPHSSTAISLKWIRIYGLMVQLPIKLPVRWRASAMSPPVTTWLWSWSFILLLFNHNCLRIFLFGRVCKCWREYCTFWGCCGPERKLLLFESVGFLAFLETDVTCLLILGALFLHRTFMRPSQVAVTWLIRILASSLSTTKYLTGWNFLSLLISSVSSMIHLWACSILLPYASTCARAGPRALSLRLPSSLHSWGNRCLKWLNGIQFVSDPESTLTYMATSLSSNLQVISVMISVLPSLSMSV